MIKVDFQDKPLRCISAFVVIFLVVALSFITISLFFYGSFVSSFIACILVCLTVMILPSSVFVNSPNEAKVLEFFGHYIGTLSKAGFFCATPFAKRRRISLKMHNMSTDIIKVNDFNGNPIEISAVIVWKVLSPVKACLNVVNYTEFIEIQSETALRELAGSYPYDHDEQKESLKKNSHQISLQLISILKERLTMAGIEIEDARISHLAYASEIAKAMLRKQQAQAIVSARIHIVRNAINMVEEILQHFETGNHQIELSLEQKITLINNLLVSLVSEQGVQPTISVI